MIVNQNIIKIQQLIKFITTIKAVFNYKNTFNKKKVDNDLNYQQQDQMNVDFYSSEELHLRFVDQQHIQKKRKTLLNDYNPLQLRNINFYDLFDIDQSVNQSNSQSNFFTNHEIKPQTHEKHDLTIFLQSQMGPLNNLISHRKTLHQFKNNNLMKSIQNIDFPTNYQELIGIFLRSHYFLYFIRFIVIANLIGLFLVDYQFRVAKNGQMQYPQLSKENIAALLIQLYCNSIFTIEVILRLYEKNQNWKDPYVIVNSIGTISCWATIFFRQIENDSNQLFRFFLALRIIRTVIRILEVFPNLRKPFEIFLSTIPSLQKLFFPIVILMIFYAITGMALFSGATKHRCVQVVQGIKQYRSLCGASLFSCPQHQSCELIQGKDHFIDSLENQYNLVNFDNIFGGIFTVYHFIYNSNFSITRGKFTYFINPYLSSLYFLSLSIIFCYIFANLIMVSMSKVYIQQIQKQQHQQEKQDNSKVESQTHNKTLVKIVTVIEVIFIIFQAVNICFTYSGMGNQASQKQALIDFVLLWITLAIVMFKIALEKTAYFSQYFNLLDLFTLGIHLVDIFICVSLNISVISYIKDFSIILRSLKILRIIRLLYVHEGIFKYQKFVITVLLQTLYKIRYFLGMILCFFFMFKQLGQLLFAYQVRIPLDQINTEKVPYIKNFEGFIPSIFNIIFLFYNEMWTQTLYNYYHAAGIQAVFFYSIVVFICFLMLMRLYIAVFLSFFKEALNKKSQEQMARLKTSKRLKENQSLPNVEMLDSSQNDNQEQKKASCIISLLQNIYQSDFFSHIIDGCIIIQCILIAIRKSNDSNQKINIISSFQIVCFTFYLVQTLLGCMSYGIYFQKNSFLKRSRSNIISLSTSIIIILSFIPFGNSQVNNYLKRIVILRIFTIFRNSNKQMTIIIDSLFVICKNFFNFVFIYSIFLIIVSIIPLKMFYNSNPFHICYFSHINNDSSTFYTQQECTQLGGIWKQPAQIFSNIFSSAALMYQLLATQSWTSYLQSLWYKNQNQHWQLYFSITFFVYNICFLNIFLGFIVETYLQLKDKAYNLDQLKRSQKAWVLIKNRINILFPLSTLAIEESSSERRKLCFSIVTHTYYQIFIDYLAIFNAFLYLITYQDMDGTFENALIFFKNCNTIIFFIDSLAKIYSFRSIFFKRNNSIIQLSGFIYTIIYWGFYLFSIPNTETNHILEFFLVGQQLLRCKSLLLKYSWCKTNLNAVINILPRCGNIIKIVGAFLFFYASLGLEIFKNIKPDNIIDNYNIGFCDIITATLTLVRVSVAEAWHTVLSAFLKQSSPENICYHITTQADALAYEGQGCGSWVAYPYFISFHIIMVLLLLNLLIATMASAYDDNYEIEFNSVNVFQLEDCLSLWQKYDPQGTGVVHYKKFWRLTSEIAILFGISKKKLIKRKNKFFQELDIQIYQHKDNPLFCYRFHDVITKFSKIKLQIAHLGYAQQKSDTNEEYDISFDISPAVLGQIKDYIIPFPQQYYNDYHPFRNYKSGETKYIFGLLNKIRQWRHVSTEKKRIVGGTKLSSIFDLKSRRVVYDSQDGSDHVI